LISSAVRPAGCWDALAEEWHRKTYGPSASEVQINARRTQWNSEACVKMYLRHGRRDDNGVRAVRGSGKVGSQKRRGHRAQHVENFTSLFLCLLQWTSVSYSRRWASLAHRQRRISTRAAW